MPKQKIEFHQLIDQLNKRAARAVVSQLNFRNPALNAFLDKRFSDEWGKPGSFLADPVVEATFGWKAANQSMQALSGSLLTEEVIHALDNPSKELASEYKFNKTWSPYEHQLDAWQTLLAEDWKSVLVSSGTGSGKTECFLVPVLDDLSRQIKTSSGPVVGVNALMLYPLNALINSQRQRLLAWTHQFKGDVRFCLYNGDTPPTAKSVDQHKTPNEVLSRKGLWESPPPILVTNSTMLEYMLVRNADRPILEQSQGKLRWIILDEAHTYIGSQAAELSLLLRRVMLAFGVKPSDVRFVATSATIGQDDEEGNQKLAKFIADVAGVSDDQVKVIRGYRDVPEIDFKPDSDSDRLDSIDDLNHLEAEDLYQHLVKKNWSVKLRENASREPVRISQIHQHFKKSQPDISSIETLQYVDQLTRAKDEKGNIFLPLRGHIFERTLGGVWACSNSKCNGVQEQEIDTQAWRFGAIYLHHQSHCSFCSAPVYELASCTDCGTEYLLAREAIVESQPKLLPTLPSTDVDEFVLDIELEEESTKAFEAGFQNRRLISPNKADRVDYIDKASCDIMGSVDDDAVRIDILLPNPDEDGDSGLRCVNCGANERNTGQKFRTKKLGAPTFLADILPTVLENSPEAKGKEKNNPSEGRRLLTFTDSRQGTARIAARLQQEADRNTVRTDVYHSLATSANTVDQVDISEKEEEIEKLKKELDVVQDFVKGVIEDRIKSLEAEIVEATGDSSASISWHDMKQQLSRDQSIGVWMLDEFKRITGANLLPDQFADFCLYREFSRRPIRVNQSETLGLVQMRYDVIDNLKKTPAQWSSMGATLEDWKDYLYLLVDYYIRANTAVFIPDSPVRFSRWMGARVYPKFLQGPGSENTGGRYQSWPKAREKGTPSRLVNILAVALHLDRTETTARNIINHFLEEAWLSIRPLLKEFSDGFQLDLAEHVSFSSPINAWRCPYSLRVLPRAFKKLSPYLPIKAQQIDYCEPVVMPKLPYRYWRNEMGAHVGASKVTEWVETNKEIQDLRGQWLWPNRSDRIAYGESWYAIGEHSAQQSSPRLKRLESDFKSGRVNILSCSTTMEMGVDIGGMSAVAMNNVPPSQANYLQRAGRAGRRKEATSVSITVCNNNAHGQQVFSNPLWPFDVNAIMAPSVRLSSEIIIQRHVNAYLLSEWLKQFDDDTPKLESGWLFLDRNGNESRATEFIAWCESFLSKPHVQMQEAINSLVARSVLEGKSLGELSIECSKIIKDIAESWLLEYGVLKSEFDMLHSSVRNADQLPAVKSLGYQMRRLAGEYLLKDLTSRGFLPGHGFPVGIVSMLTTTIQDLKRGQDNQSREDNLLSSIKGAMRESKVAIREYAPGAEFVVDGKVYESSGITLNWHIPADAEGMSEIQDLKWYWFCKSCGSGGTSINKTAVCNSCGDTNLQTKEIIQPAGFAVDIRYEPHNDINTPKYLPYNDPRVQIGQSNWQSFPDKRLGRFRSSDQGSILYWNAGQSNAGYSVCLYCGRAVDQGDREKNRTFHQEHRRLRGGKDLDGSSICEGSYNDFAIKKDLWLTAESTTSIVELQLLDPITAEPINDEGLAWSIGFALRHGLVTALGIDSREVSVAIQHFKDAAFGSLFSIFLYDTAEMGAGYVEQMPQLMSVALRNAITLLECHQHCDTACHSCLLGWDSQHHVEYLNRHLAKSWLENWSKSLSLPKEIQYFGKNSHAELRPIIDALRTTRYQNKNEALWLFVDGDISDWQMSNWNILPDIQFWANEGLVVNIGIPEQLVNELTDSEKRMFLALNQFYQNRINIHQLKAENKIGENAKIIAIMESDRSILWATENPNLLPGEYWGGADNVIVSGDTEKLILPSKLLSDEDFHVEQAQDENVSIVNFKSELDGSITDFGNKFWREVSFNSPVFANRFKSNKITKIKYTDRYIASPLHAALLFSVISSIKENISENIQIDFISALVNEPKYPGRQFRDNWQISLNRDQVVRGVIESVINKKVNFESLGKYQIEHRRSLLISWDNGEKTTIWLDEGFGSWRAKFQSFDFTVDVLSQIKQVMKAKFTVNIANSSIGTWALIKND